MIKVGLTRQSIVKASLSQFLSVQRPVNCSTICCSANEVVNCLHLPLSSACRPGLPASYLARSSFAF